MERCVERLHGELAAIRSGRASSGMLEHVKADVYGERMPLSAVATVLVRDPQLLVVSVFDPSVWEFPTFPIIYRALNHFPSMYVSPVKVPGHPILRE